MKKEKIFINFDPKERTVELKSRAFHFKSESIMENDYKVVVQMQYFPQQVEIEMLNSVKSEVEEDYKEEK